MAKPPVRRVFFVPSRDDGWEVLEATKGDEGWELRRPGRIGFDLLPTVPRPGADWVEADWPKREPRKPARPMTRPPPPKGKAREPAPKALPRTAVPNLSLELEALMLKEQRSQPVPKGKLQCPLCGLILEPMRAKKVRTHDNPITGSRCVASGKAWAAFEPVDSANS